MDVIHEYEDPDDEWARDGCREIGPLNDVTFLIQRIHEGTIARRRADDRRIASLPLSLPLLPPSISRSIFLPAYIRIYRWYLSAKQICELSVVSRQYLSRDRERERERGRRRRREGNPATVSVTLHPPRTNNVQLDTLLPAPTSGSSSNGGRSLSSSLLRWRRTVSSFSLQPRVAFSPLLRHPSLPVRQLRARDTNLYIPSSSSSSSSSSSFSSSFSSTSVIHDPPALENIDRFERI